MEPTGSDSGVSAADRLIADAAERLSKLELAQQQKAQRSDHAEAQRVVAAPTSRQPAIPVTGHGPAAPMSTPQKAEKARRASTPMKPRTTALPHEDALRDATLPTMIDLSVDLSRMSQGALVARRQLLEVELRRVAEALDGHAERQLVVASGDDRQASESAARSGTALTERSGVARGSQRMPSPQRPSTPRLSGRSQRGVSTSSEALRRNPLADELRSIAHRVSTPSRSRYSTRVDQLPRADGRLAHPGSQPPSPQEHQLAYLESCLDTGPNYLAFAKPSTPSTPHYLPQSNFFASSASQAAHTVIQLQPAAARDFSASLAAATPAAAPAGLAPTPARPAAGLGLTPRAASRTPSTAGAGGAGTGGAGTPASRDYMYPPHHDALLSELAELRRRRLAAEGQQA